MVELCPEDTVKGEREHIEQYVDDTGTLFLGRLSFTRWSLH